MRRAPRPHVRSRRALLRTIPIAALLTASCTHPPPHSVIETEEGPDGIIRRKAGTIHVVGTATSDYGVFNVDVSL